MLLRGSCYHARATLLITYLPSGLMYLTLLAIDDSPRGKGRVEKTSPSLQFAYSLSVARYFCLGVDL